MRLRGAPLRFIVATWVMTVAWLGCNAILGNESATFVGDAGAAPTVTVTAPPPPPPEAGACEGVDLTRDPRHCGACGHDCLGGACVGSRCQPFVIATVPFSAHGLALDETYAYVTDVAFGDVLRAPLVADGGALGVIFDGPPGLGSRLVGPLLFGGDVYFSSAGDAGGIFRCPRAGCPDAGPTAVGPVGSTRVARIVDGGSLLFSRATDGGGIFRCALPACSPIQQIATADEIADIDERDGVTYWSLAGGGVFRSPGVQIDNISGACPKVEVTSSDVFFACGPNGLRARSRDGGATRLIDPSNIETITHDESSFYSASVGALGEVVRCDLASGCSSPGAVLAQEQPFILAIAVDATSIVWLTGGESSRGIPAAIVRLAK